MSRKRKLRNTLLLCSLPVVVASAVVILRGARKDAPYVAGKETEGITRSLDRTLEEPSCPLRFTDVAAEAGLDFVNAPWRRTSQLPEDMGSGAAWGDYDGDGRPDLFLANLAAPLGGTGSDPTAECTDRLFHNRGDGTFEDVTATAGVGRAHLGMGAAWGDFDADGDADLVVTAWGRNVLWENRGDGTFADVTEAAGLTGEGFWAGASWCDFDLDGDLDLYVCGYVRYEPEDPAKIAAAAGDSDFPFTLNPSSWPPHPNRLWVNRGDGTFEDRSEAAGVVGENGRSLSAAWADFDDDGWPDLYVANDVSDNVLWLNNRDGTFRDASYEAVVADYRGAMGIAVGDWDGDLDLDLFITHWIAQENALYSSQLSESRAGGDDVGLLFVDEADRVGLGQIALDLIGWGTSFQDLDLDGLPDLFVANGSTFQDAAARERLVAMDPHLYWNRGPEQGFFEVGAEAGIRTSPPGVGRGAAFADYDADGDLDLVVCRRGGAARLLRNDSRTGHGVTLRLRGTSLHHSALGAHVVAHAGSRAWLREVGAGSSYLSQDAADLVIGLGASDRVDSVEVRWPGGAREYWNGLETGRVYEIVEGQAPVAVEIARAGPGPAPASEPDREDVREFWRRKREGDRAQLEQRWEDAERAFAAVLELDPRHEDSLYSRGNCLLELGRYAEAERCWEELLEVNPGASRAWVQIGMVRSMPEAGALWDPAAAAHALDEAHRINPEESGPLIRAGEARLAAGDLEGAEETLAAAASMNHMATSALFLSGYLAWKRGDAEQATRLLDLAAESLREELPSAAASSEGDTRGENMAEIRRRAAERRLFATCVERLRDDDEPTPGGLYPAVDEYLAGLPRPAPGAPGSAAARQSR